MSVGKDPQLGQAESQPASDLGAVGGGYPQIDQHAQFNLADHGSGHAHPGAGHPLNYGAHGLADRLKAAANSRRLSLRLEESGS